MWFSRSVLGLFAVSMVASAGGHHYAPNDEKAVELKTIQSLIFRKGAMTTGRRTSPVAQLACTGGGACGSGYDPSVVHCSNIGVDYATGDPSWKCTAELENGLRLGTTDVVCEGFRDRDDPWILRGSCGLEYTLEGQSARARSSGSYGDSYSTYKAYTSNPRPTYSSSWGGGWINWMVGLFILWLFFRFISGPSPSVNHAQAATGGYGGGGGTGGWFGGGGGGGGGFGRGQFGRGHYRADDCNQAGVGGGGIGGGGGFWQGLGAGAGLGYLFGRNNNWGYGNNYYAQPGWGNRWGGWGGGQPYYGGGGGFAQAAPAPQVVNTGPATQTATGYGGTRRRG
jgi:hypothetical protein